MWMETLTLRVPAMTCRHAVRTVTAALRDVVGCADGPSRSRYGDGGGVRDDGCGRCGPGIARVRPPRGMIRGSLLSQPLQRAGRRGRRARGAVPAGCG